MKHHCGICLQHQEMDGLFPSTGQVLRETLTQLGTEPVSPSASVPPRVLERGTEQTSLPETGKRMGVGGKRFAQGEPRTVRDAGGSLSREGPGESALKVRRREKH